MKLPKSKFQNIVVQHLVDETLIYNLKTNQTLCLNATSTKVFNACDGTQTFADLKRQYHFTDDLIHLALEELKEWNLLEDYQTNYFDGLSRRDVIKRVGLASISALPVVAAIVAPTAAQAASTCANPGGQPAGFVTPQSCGGNQAQCNALCNTNASSFCCSNTATAAPNCNFGCACICA